MTKLVLIKYPQSLLDTMPLNQTIPSDARLGLTKAGKAVAQQIAERLSVSLQGDISIWSSPARRCKEPAKIIADVVGQTTKTDPRLDERKLSARKNKITVGGFRERQERGYLNPSRLGADEIESPLTHRLRVEGWLAETLGVAKQEDIIVVVSHGAVVEHLHSSLCGKPAEGMASSFTFCAPGHAHLWSDVELPDKRRIWCCLGANVNLADSTSFAGPMRGFEDLNALAVDLASDPSFQKLVKASGSKAPASTEKYYIR